MIGIKKLRVLPVPVCAVASTSLPSRAGGMAAACIGVGVTNLAIAIFFCSEAEIGKSVNAVIFPWSRCTLPTLGKGRDGNRAIPGSGFVHCEKVFRNAWVSAVKISNRHEGSLSRDGSAVRTSPHKALWLYDIAAHHCEAGTLNGLGRGVNADGLAFHSKN